MDWMVRDAEVIDALKGLVEDHPRWGFWKYVKALRHRGSPWNHKRIYRVYCALGLNQPRRTRRKLPERPREALFVPETQNQVWSPGKKRATIKIQGRWTTSPGALFKFEA